MNAKEVAERLGRGETQQPLADEKMAEISEYAHTCPKLAPAGEVMPWACCACALIAERAATAVLWGRVREILTNVDRFESGYQRNSQGQMRFQSKHSAAIDAILSLLPASGDQPCPSCNGKGSVSDPFPESATGWGCTRCNGSGRLSASGDSQCASCNGSGKVPRPIWCSGGHVATFPHGCNLCERFLAQGTTETDPCCSCEGSGRMPASGDLAAKVEAIGEVEWQWGILGIGAASDVPYPSACASRQHAEDWVTRFPAHYKLVRRTMPGPWVDVVTGDRLAAEFGGKK